MKFVRPFSETLGTLPAPLPIDAAAPVAEIFYVRFRLKLLIGLGFVNHKITRKPSINESRPRWQSSDVLPAGAQHAALEVPVRLI